MKVPIAAILLGLALIAAAHAISPAEQEIIFGRNSTASGSAGCTMNGTFDLTNTCNDIYLIGRRI